MGKNNENNFAFIDSNNLHLGVSNNLIRNNVAIYSGWKIDYRKFRTYLRDKYMITKAYIFIGYKPENSSMYTYLQSIGYICVFKPVLELKNGKVKGNVDAELVLHTMIEFNNFDKALIISGDGDFYCLIEYLILKNKLKKVFIPNLYT